MEAAAVVATSAQPAAPPPPPPAESSSAADFAEVDPIFAALAGHKPEEATSEGEQAEAEAAKTKPEPEKPKEDAEKPDAKSKRKALEAEVFSEKALSTPEGISKAREYLNKRQAKLDGLGQRNAETRSELEQRAQAIDAAYKAASAEIEQQRGYARKLVELGQKLNNPSSVEEFLEALGAVSGRPGIEVWENGARFMVNGGKRPPPSREVEELRSHIQRLERSLAERDTKGEEAKLAEETARAREFVERRSGEIVTAAKDATKYPELAKHAALGAWGESIVKEVAGMKRAAKAKGQRLGDAEALGIIEGELKKLTASGARVPASPAEATSVDASRVSSIAPSMTRSAGSLREKTEAELAEDLAKDTAALSFVLGTPIG